MDFVRSLGFRIAQAILALTGNLEVAAALRVLPTISSLPLRLRVEGSHARLEFPFGPEEWVRWQKQVENDRTPAR